MLVIRMSGAGKCKRALSAELLGMKPAPAPAFLKRAAKEGKLHEWAIKKELQEEEDMIVYDEQLEVVIKRDQYVLTGHIDGKVLDVGGKIPKLLEIKSMSEGEYYRWLRGRWEAFETYAAQASLYMKGLGLDECLYYVKNRNTGDVDRAVMGPPRDAELIMSQIDVAVQWVLSTKTLIAADFDPASIDCKRCFYRDQICLPEEKIPDDITRKDLDVHVHLWRAGKAKVDEGETQMEIAKVRFKEILKILETDKLNHNKLSITTIHRHNEAWNGKYLKAVLSTEQVNEALKITDVEYIRIMDINERYK